MGIAGQVHADGRNGHRPFVHSEPAAPPEAQRSLRPFGGRYLVYRPTGAVRFLIGQLPSIAHARKEHHQPLRVRADVWIVGNVYPERFLLFKHPRGIAGGRLRQTEEKVGRGHEIRWEHIELNADPQHQRHAEYAAQHHTGMLFREQQPRRRQVGQAVHDQQRPAGKGKILKNHIRKGQHLKVRQHGVHAQALSAGVQQHRQRPRHGTQTDEQRPENQDAPGCTES